MKPDPHQALRAAVQRMQHAVLASQGTKQDSDRRAALKDIQRALALTATPAVIRGVADSGGGEARSAIIQDMATWSDDEWDMLLAQKPGLVKRFAKALAPSPALVEGERRERYARLIRAALFGVSVPFHFRFEHLADALIASDGVQDHSPVAPLAAPSVASPTHDTDLRSGDAK